ncbi:MAG: orotate phosphoribosyltransferase [Candidatus Acidiferrales bacterium]
MENITSLKGPIETVEGQLVLRIPLAAGGAQLIECSRGIAEVAGECLNVSIPEWLAEKLGIEAGSQVRVDNYDGKFNIHPVNHRAELADVLRKKSLMRGEFTLSSGKKSNYYLDCRLTTLDAQGALLTGYCILELLDEMQIEPDAIGGLSMGADPVVSAAIVVSALENRPLPGFLVRKEAKKHGRQKQIEGMENLGGKKVVIVDDVCTTGGSTQEAIDAVEHAGAEVIAVISLVDREEGGSNTLRAKYNYRSVFTARELLAPD